MNKIRDDALGQTVAEIIAATIAAPTTNDGLIEWYGGCWRFKDCSLSVASVAFSVGGDAGRKRLLKNYGKQYGLTNAMIDAALAFDFPPMQNPVPKYDDLTVECACGEEAGIEGSWQDQNDYPGSNVYRCGYCGKRWRMTISLEELSDDGDR